MQTRPSYVRSCATERVAVRFFRASVVVFVLAAGLAWLLIETVPAAVARGDVSFPAAFWISSLLLCGGSVMLHRATWDVRRERQQPFRRALISALIAGTLFIGVQSYGLWHLLQQQRPAEVATGSGAFVFVFSFLHGMHFVVAMLFLVFVTVQALADRYDHEYYWGVVVCGYFWHTLGVVWLAILGVFAIVT